MYELNAGVDERVGRRRRRDEAKEGMEMREERLFFLSHSIAQSCVTGSRQDVAAAAAAVSFQEQETHANTGAPV